MPASAKALRSKHSSNSREQNRVCVCVCVCVWTKFVCVCVCVNKIVCVCVLQSILRTLPLREIRSHWGFEQNFNTRVFRNTSLEIVEETLYK